MQLHFRASSNRYCSTGALRHIAIRNLYVQAPLLEQPFWDVAPVPVGRAPTSEFERGEVRLRCEVQTFHRQLKLSRHRRQGLSTTAPLRIPASAHVESDQSTLFSQRQRGPMQRIS